MVHLGFCEQGAVVICRLGLQQERRLLASSFLAARARSLCLVVVNRSDGTGVLELAHHLWRASEEHLQELGDTILRPPPV